jgi:hypothetical protein
MPKPKLTILTAPVPFGFAAPYEHLWRASRRIVYSIRQSPTLHPLYGGHSAVTRSVVEGFAKIAADFNYNPSRLSDLADIVHIPGGLRPLRQMIQFKQEGRIKRLTCGPNIVVMSTEHDSIIASPEIDSVINHVDWACEFWAVDHPQLLTKCFCWPAGVDTAYWRPLDGSTQSRSILIFDKRHEADDPHRTRPYQEYLRGLGWQVEVLTRCGSLKYTAQQYRELLRNTTLLIGFTMYPESQGIAWAEAWSCNVPTLISQFEFHSYKGRRYRGSAAPFLTPTTGLFFNDLDHFKEQFAYWQSHRDQFTPRKWVMGNMSDEVSARLLYRHLVSEDI